MRNRLPCLLLLLTGLAVAAPDWSKVRFEFTPAKGIEELHLDEPVPEKWPSQLGQPDRVLPYHDTGEGFRRLVWGEMKKGRLHKGVSIMVVGHKEEATVIDIMVRRVRATVADSDLFLGLPVERLKKRSKQIQKDGDTSYQLPGVVLEANGGKVTGLRVSSPKETRWRFTRWTVRPGRQVGPILLGEPLDESLWQAIGKPHQQTRERVTWSSRDGGQKLVIFRDARSGEVTRIKGVGLPWKTPRDVSLGDSVKTYQARHSEAKRALGDEHNEVYMKMAGLRATFHEDSLVGFDVFPIPPSR